MCLRIIYMYLLHTTQYFSNAIGIPIVYFPSSNRLFLTYCPFSKNKCLNTYMFPQLSVYLPVLLCLSDHSCLSLFLSKPPCLSVFVHISFCLCVCPTVCLPIFASLCISIPPPPPPPSPPHFSASSPMSNSPAPNPKPKNNSQASTGSVR